jgi:hypothetical protein
MRGYALHHLLLPAYESIADEVIVVGEWQEGAGYTYIHSPSRFFSAVDALEARQRGFEAASGDFICFVHDDHFVDLKDFDHLPWWQADVWVPRRWRRTEAGFDALQNNGMPNYVGGHCAFYRREILERAPWGEVEKVHAWDVDHTVRLRSVGARIAETSLVNVYDVEVVT